MAQEIRQVPAAVARLLTDGHERAALAAAAVARAAPRWASIVARGTSDHAGVYAQYLIETHLRIPTGLAAPSVTTVYRVSLEWRGGLVMAISQSGRSPDIVSVIEEARAGGALTLAVTNDAASPLGEAAEYVLECHAGPERSVAATKTYVAQLVTVADLVARLAPESPLGAALEHLPDVLEDCLPRSERWIEEGGVVDALAASTTSLVVSRGYNLATALEVALKLKETSGLFAQGYSTADFEHGPRVVAGPAVPMLVFRPGGEMGARIDETLGRVEGLEASAWMVRDDAGPNETRSLGLALDLPEALTPAALVLPGQLVAEAVARRRGLDPDDPPGLHKVTLTL